MNPDSIFIDCAGLRVHVSAWGDRKEPVLFLMHSMLDHSRSWDWIAREFASDFRIYAPDLRGHGDAEWAVRGAYSLPNFILDLDDVTSELGVDRFAQFRLPSGLPYRAAVVDRVSRCQSLAPSHFA